MPSKTLHRSSRIESPVYSAHTKSHSSQQQILPSRAGSLGMCGRTGLASRRVKVVRKTTEKTNSKTVTTTNTEKSTAETVHIWPRYPLIPHARVNSLRKSLLAAWADREHWRLSGLVRVYLDKHPPQKMSAYEKAKISTTIDDLIAAMRRHKSN
ncbi:hypothetical protein MPH_09584 [Macrophomina phaseolina MS6]|uniref:Uncharacterized protein n=1 Tax=Macrophomina phaseolina (strain MS6) TaxID=1126212 RepID=K2RKB9_MACPH|nr:hypothetical protein MPH_09584 [Macrophomina phaseolina MS6]